MIYHSRCPRCNHSLVSTKNNEVEYKICENCGSYQLKGQELIESFGLIIHETRNVRSYIPILKEEDLIFLRKAMPGKKTLRIFSNGKMKVKRI